MTLQHPSAHFSSAFAAEAEPRENWLHRINWVSLGMTLALEAVFLAGLLLSGVVPIHHVKSTMKLIQLSPEMAPPPDVQPPQPPKTMDQPDPRPDVKSEIVVPTPAVPLPAPAPQLVVSSQPSPAPVPAEPRPAVPAAAPGPVNVANLGASLISGTPPRYPMDARRKREQGMVVLRLVISEQGRVSDISIFRSSDHSSLDQAALEAVRRWRWSPLMRDGRAVVVTGLVQIPFILKE